MSGFELDPAAKPPFQHLLESGNGERCSAQEEGQRDCFVRFEDGSKVLHCYGPCGLTRVSTVPNSEPGQPEDIRPSPRAAGAAEAPIGEPPTGRNPTGQPVRHVEKATVSPETSPGAACKNGASHHVADVNSLPDRARHVEVARTGKRPAPSTKSVLSSDKSNVWPWPAPLDQKVYAHSIAGVWAAYLDEAAITEADPAAVLMHTLTALSAMVGLGPRLEHGSVTVPPKWFILVVGESARGRKGTAWDCAFQLLHEVDDAFMTDRVLSGFGSGEALIKPIADGDDQAVERDRRLLVMQTEFVNVLRVAERPSSTLSPNLRDLYDVGPVRNITKSETLVASRHHVALIGHITPSELQDSLKGTALSNGFGSRLLMVASRRARLISRPAPVDPFVLESLSRQLRDAVECARRVEAVSMNDEARDRWDDLYPEIEGRELPQVAATLTHRASPLTLRIALLHAVLDAREHINAADLDVAAEIVRYGTETVLHVFGDRLGDERAEALLEATRCAGPEGLTGRQRTKLFNNNVGADELNDLMGSLVSFGLCATFSPRRAGGGRPPTLLVANEHMPAAVVLHGEAHAT